MNRLKYIDTAKGLGILLVILGHASLKNSYVLTYIYSFHMPLFFVISGILLYITSAKDREYIDIVKGRLFSIMLPYLIFSIIYTIIDFASHDEYAMVDLRASITLQGSGPLWFLPTLFLSEMIFIAIMKYTKPTTGLICSNIAGYLALLIPKLMLHYGIDILHPDNEYLQNILLFLFRSATCLIFLATGYLLIQIIEKIKSSFVTTLSGTIMMIINIPFSLYCYISSSDISDSITGIDMHNMNLGNSNIMFVLCASLGSIGLILICKGTSGIVQKHVLKTINQIISFWGTNSLLIMVTHLNCKVMYAGNLFAMFLNPHISHAKEYVFLFNVLLITLLIETLLIIIVNNLCPWIVGKKKRAVK